MRSPQFSLIKNSVKEYGGDLLKKRKGRLTGRPLDTKNTIHLVLRSTQAAGDWSFSKKVNQKKLTDILAKFSLKYAVKILSMANVGNHLHFQIKLATRYTYRKFIRAITGAIAMAVTRASRNNKLDKNFWDYRPFTRVVIGFKAMLTLRNYIEMNELEGLGCNRMEAFDILEAHRKRFA